MLAGHHQVLIEYRTSGSNGLLAMPTPEHYLPLYMCRARNRRKTR